MVILSYLIFFCYSVAVIMNDAGKSLRRLALITFARASAWIVGPVILGLVAGKFLDGRFGTTPYLFIASMLLAFAGSMVGVLKELRHYIAIVDTENTDGK